MTQPKELLKATLNGVEGGITYEKITCFDSAQHGLI